MPHKRRNRLLNDVRLVERAEHANCIETNAISKRFDESCQYWVIIAAYSTIPAPFMNQSASNEFSHTPSLQVAKADSGWPVKVAYGSIRRSMDRLRKRNILLHAADSFAVKRAQKHSSLNVEIECHDNKLVQTGKVAQPHVWPQATFCEHLTQAIGFGNRAVARNGKADQACKRFLYESDAPVSYKDAFSLSFVAKQLQCLG